MTTIGWEMSDEMKDLLMILIRIGADNETAAKIAGLQPQTVGHFRTKYNYMRQVWQFGGKKKKYVGKHHG